MIAEHDSAAPPPAPVVQTWVVTLPAPLGAVRYHAEKQAVSPGGDLVLTTGTMDVAWHPKGCWTGVCLASALVPAVTVTAGVQP